MRIRIAKDAKSGNVPIPANEYWVSLQHEAGEMLLSAGGKDLRLKAMRRRKAGRTRHVTVQFACGGGRTWSLVVSTPKYGEWVCFIEYTA